MIYLVRHGQTEFNATYRVQGGLDSELTELGVSQARRVAALLAALIPAPQDWRILSSPQGRALRTAGFIAQALGLADIAPEARLREISLGDWDGLTHDDIDARYPGARAAHDAWNWYYHAPGGETYEAVEARVRHWLEEEDREGASLVVVSHGIAGRVLRALYAGIAPPEARRLATPQDAVFRLSGGRIERIDCPPAS